MPDSLCSFPPPWKRIQPFTETMKFIASALSLLVLSTPTVHVSADRVLKGGGTKAPKAPKPVKPAKVGKSYKGTVSPTVSPSAEPTSSPTVSPTAQPTASPTAAPTIPCIALAQTCSKGDVVSNTFLCYGIHRLNTN
jgi:hypothetical protein